VIANVLVVTVDANGESPVCPFRGPAEIAAAISTACGMLCAIPRKVLGS
jgi:hypothetical protein